MGTTFKHKRAIEDGASPPEYVGLELRRKAAVGEEGTFEVPEDIDDYEATVERFVDHGHELLDDVDDEQEDDDDSGDDQDPEDETAVQASDYSEDDLVAMGRNELRSIASQYDDINGNASEDKLREELILKLREEADE